MVATITKLLIKEWDENEDLIDSKSFSGLLRVLSSINTRWKSMIILIENNNATSTNIVLRSIFEIQKNMEIIMRDKKFINEKLKSFEFYIVVQNLMIYRDQNKKDLIDVEKISYKILNEQFIEIKDEVLNEVKYGNFNKYRWRTKFTDLVFATNFLAANDAINEDSLKIWGDVTGVNNVIRSIYRRLSLSTHGYDIENEINWLDIEKHDDLSREDMSNILIILSDYLIIFSQFASIYVEENSNYEHDLSKLIISLSQELADILTNGNKNLARGVIEELIEDLNTEINYFSKEK